MKSSMRVCAPLLVALSLLGPLAAQGAAVWKAGVAKVNITPKESIWMAGYGFRNRPSEGIRKEIFATALALQDAGGSPAVLVTFDLEGLERTFADPIAERCRKQFGLQRDRLVLNVSHTHSGPVVGDQVPSYAGIQSEQKEVVRRYTERLADQAVAVVGQAIANLAPATLEFEQGLAGIAVNRRRARDHSLPGPVDHDVPVLSVRGSSGNLIAIVVGYSCHATSMGDYRISGDWPGYAKLEIERTHPGAVALFVQGCGADSNPLPRYQGTDPALLPYAEALPQLYGKSLAAAVDLVLHAKMKPVTGSLLSAFETVDLPIRVPTREQLQARLKDPSEWERHNASLLLAKIDHEGKLPDRYTYPVQVWQFGSDLKMIILGGEVVVDYSLRLKGRYGWDNTWVAGYSNVVAVYIPSLRVLREGGYEGGGANESLGGPFGEDVEEIVAKKVNDLVERTNPR
jgi:neutral ceramidase